MNSFGKVCVVFVTASSLAFVAFAGAMRSGGRNWPAEAQAISNDYTLTITQGEQGTSYSMAQRRTNANVGSASPVLPDVVTQASAKRVSTARDELTKLTADADSYKPKTEAALAAAVADEAGIKKREAALNQQLDEVAAQIAKTNDQIIETANEIQKIRNEGQERREEVYRLTNVLELLRNDLFAAQAQRKNLQEEEVRLREILQRLERRNQQLSGQPAAKKYEEEEKSGD